MNKTKMIIKSIIPYVLIVLIALLIRVVFLINANVPTGSMNDTIPTESRILGTKFAYWFGNTPQRGDIIVFDAPDSPETLYVKRVIGIGGDTVEVKQEEVEYNGEKVPSCFVYVNGEKIDEPYLREKIWNGGEGIYKVPNGCAFCMGDNRNESLDARYWNNKFVPYDTISGKAYWLYWPISKMHWLY